MSLKFASLTAFMLLSAATLCANSQGQLHLYDLSETRRISAGVTDLSADGRAAAGIIRGTNPNMPSDLASQSFHWDESLGFQRLPYQTSYTSQSASGISGDGRYVVGQVQTSSGLDGRRGFFAYRQLRDGPIEYLRGLNDSNESHAVAASFDGNIVVGASTVPAEPGNENNRREEAFRWTPATGAVSMGSMGPNSIRTIPYGMSHDGNTVIGSSVEFFADGPSRPFHWTAEAGYSELVVPNATDYLDANVIAISGNGLVSVGSSLLRSTLLSVPVLWNDSTIGETLPVLPGMVLAGASGVNMDGSVIVGSGTFDINTRAVPIVWLNGAEDAPIFLADHLSSFGISLPQGWRYSGVFAVSGDGRTFGGSVWSPSNIEYAFIATVPSVSPVMVLAATSMLSPIRRHRKQ